MTTLYVAGPMTGLPDLNYPAFLAAEKDLIAAGYLVRNPAHIDTLHNHTGEPQAWDWYMRHAIRMLLSADGVALLPGWRESRGARIEQRLAADLEMPVYYAREWVKARAMRA